MTTTSDVERELFQSDPEHYVLGPSSKDNSQSMLQDIAKLLDSKLEQKLSCFKRSFEDKDAHYASEIKKIKSEAKAASSFNFKGNRVQFEFNCGISDGVEECLIALTEGNLVDVATNLKGLMAKISKRNKLIRFADKSPAGWTAVDEYESDELAENSEDEKKLRSAERRALAKMKVKAGQPKRAKPTATFTRSTANFVPQRNMNTPMVPQQPFRSFQRSFRPYGRVASDKCFSCGAAGHWAGSPKCINSYNRDSHQTDTTRQSGSNSR